MIEIIKTSAEKLESFRIKYLDLLPVFQDAYLEFLICESDSYELFSDNHLIGYALVTKDNILLEFFIETKFSAISVDVFTLIVSELGIKSVYCKSFDFLLLDCCLTKKLSYSPIGCLYRDYIGNNIQRRSELVFRYADNSDLPFMYNQDDEVFEPKELLDSFIRNKGIVILHHNDLIIGCGFLTQIHPEYKYFDIGVWVSPENRMKGYATQIMSFLMDLCLRNDRLPVVGCDINNTASQRMLKGLGFVSKYKLIEFKI